MGNPEDVGDGRAGGPTPPRAMWAPPETRKPRPEGAHPRWAIAAVALGAAAGAAALFLDGLYVTRHLDDPSRYDSFALVPNVVLVPVSALLLALGGRALVAEPRRKVVIVILAVAWALVVWFAPQLLTGPVQPAV